MLCYYVDESNRSRVVAMAAARTLLHLVMYEPGRGMVHGTVPASEGKYMRPVPNHKRAVRSMASAMRRYGATKAARRWFRKARREDA